MSASGLKEWRDEEWWHPDAIAARRAVGEQFGVADPDKVMAQVNEICSTRLP